MKKYILLAFALIFQTVISQAMEGDDKGVIEMGVWGKVHENHGFGNSSIPFDPSSSEKQKRLNNLPTIIEEPIIEEQILLIQNGNEGIIYILRTLTKGHPILGE